MEAIHAEGTRLGLSRETPARLRLSNIERLGREAAERDKVEKFAPVQAALAARFGEHASRFILSNGTVNDLLRRNLTLGGLKRSYKQALIRSAAAGLGIDLSSYE